MQPSSSCAAMDSRPSVCSMTTATLLFPERNCIASPSGDSNSDGISAADEVMPVRKAGIVSIAVTADRREDDLHPLNPGGITVLDSTPRPVWDWFAESAGSA